MDIVIIGAGNVAHYFSHILRLNGHQIRQVLSRKEEHARTLAESLNTRWATNLIDIDMNADIYLLAVSDTAIPDLNKKLYLGKRIVAHTAGAVPLNAIKDISLNTGVIYPLQSFRKGIHVNHKIPLLIEAGNAIVLKRLHALADAISDHIIEMDSVSRLKMHLAAVFCNNFSNHLITICKKYCEDESLDFSLLQPLMKETFYRLENMNAEELQTGPAIRGDEETMMKHLYLLKSYPEMRKVYQLLSESIEKYSSNQD
ncbi:MAG: DUF2520 domain-containing protein [Chitinophagaceae bacterium]|jgi:predicted short-subunit dehydrogenase-like oxidoreductase (DUF2520 family)|nr:MAG: DUF2520 domain-containing protein [Chitinophagaceae bacterium]